jgi:hypothetical protein
MTKDYFSALIDMTKMKKKYSFTAIWIKITNRLRVSKVTYPFYIERNLLKNLMQK